MKFECEPCGSGLVSRCNYASGAIPAIKRRGLARVSAFNHGLKPKQQLQLYGIAFVRRDEIQNNCPFRGRRVIRVRTSAALSFPLDDADAINLTPSVKWCATGGRSGYPNRFPCLISPDSDHVVGIDAGAVDRSSVVQLSASSSTSWAQEGVGNVISLPGQ